MYFLPRGVGILTPGPDLCRNEFQECADILNFFSLLQSLIDNVLTKSVNGHSKLEMLQISIILNLFYCNSSAEFWFLFFASILFIVTQVET